MAKGLKDSNHIELKEKFGDAVNKLEQHLRLKYPAGEEEFNTPTAKEGGRTAGYIAKRSNDKQHAYMVKTAEAKAVDVEVDGRGALDRVDLSNELLTGGLYKALLYDRAPEIQAVQLEEKGKIALTSRFFDNYQSFYDFRDELYAASAGTTPTKDQLPKGFEKVMAACMFLGEYDGHGNNIGVVEKEGKNIFVKIDHGRSGVVTYKDAQDAIIKFAQIYESRGYADEQYITMDMGKFKDALQQMTKISDREIEHFVTRQLDELKKQGFDVRDTNRDISATIAEFTREDVVNQQGTYINKDYKIETKTKFESTKEFEDYYTGLIKNQREIMKQVVLNLEIVNEVYPKLSKVEENKWLIELANKELPIICAIKNDRKIKGQDPVKWAQENGVRIENKDPIIWAKENNVRIKLQDPLVYAITNKIKIENTDPIVWAIENNIKIKGQHPLELAKTMGLKIEGEPPAIWEKKNIERFTSKMQAKLEKQGSPNAVTIALKICHRYKGSLAV